MINSIGQKNPASRLNGSSGSNQMRFTELASDSDDGKRMYPSERRAERKIKDKPSSSASPLYSWKLPAYRFECFVELAKKL